MLINLFRALSGSQWERERLLGEVPAVAEYDGLAAKLISFKSKSTHFGERGVSSEGCLSVWNQGDHRGTDGERGSPRWGQQVKGHWRLCEFFHTG